MEIENVGEESFTLYGPNKLIQYQLIDEGIFSTYTLKPNETLKATTRESSMLIIEPQNSADRATAKYNEIIFSKGGKYYQENGGHMSLGFIDEYEDGKYYSSGGVSVSGDETALIENSGNSNLLVYAPKNVTMTATDEKVFKEY